MSPVEIFITVFGGMAAGAINTVAGSGSAITLTILIEVLGLSPNLANGTNRIGVMFQSTTSSYVFYKNGIIDIPKSMPIIIPTFIGAIVGVLTAVYISNEAFMSIFQWLMLGLLLTLLVNPKRWLQPSGDRTAPPWLMFIVFLAIGFYGGFIQMGMGIIFLAGMVLMAKHDLIFSNAAKVLVTALYTLVVLGIFQYHGLLDWKIGLLMAVGQVVGAYFMAQFASKHKNAKVWAYRLLLVAIVLALAKFFFF